MLRGCISKQMQFYKGLGKINKEFHLIQHSVSVSVTIKLSFFNLFGKIEQNRTYNPPALFLLILPIGEEERHSIGFWIFE